MKLQLLIYSFDYIHAFSISSTLANARLKLAKNYAEAKQQAELSPFENYSLSSSVLSSKNNGRYSKKSTKDKSVLLTLCEAEFENQK